MPVEEAKWVGLRLASDRYEIHSKLAEGGMAVVYLARDQQSEIEVVVKVPHTNVVKDEIYAGRFAREIKMLVGLYHPHIVTITDYGEHEGHPYAVMNYLSGGSLRDMGKLHNKPNEAVWQLRNLDSWLPGVADALDFIHEKHYIHRDVKPDNILFDKNGHVFLSDFGIAKVLAENPSENKPTVLPTEHGIMLGTPHYVAPEVIQQLPCTPASDQFSLAMILYEFFLGRHPFAKMDWMGIYNQWMKHELSLLSAEARWVSQSVSDEVHRALSREPTRRFVDCKSFAAAVIFQVKKTMPQLLVSAASDSPADYKELTCPSCRKRLRVNVTQKLKRVRCAQCHSTLFVPADMGVLQLASDYVTGGKSVLRSESSAPPDLEMEVETPGSSKMPTTLERIAGLLFAKLPPFCKRLLQGKNRRYTLIAAGACLALLLLVLLISWWFSGSISRENAICGKMVVRNGGNSFDCNMRAVVRGNEYVRYDGTIQVLPIGWNVDVKMTQARFANPNQADPPKENDKAKPFTFIRGNVAKSGDEYAFSQLIRDYFDVNQHPFDGKIHKIDVLKFRKLYFPREDQKLRLPDAYFHGKMTFFPKKLACRAKDLFFATKNGVERIEGTISPSGATVIKRNADNQTVVGTTICGVDLSFTPAKWKSVKAIPFLDENAVSGRSTTSKLTGTIEWRETATIDATNMKSANVTYAEITFRINAERCTKEQIHHMTCLLMFLTGPLTAQRQLVVPGQ